MSDNQHLCIECNKIQSHNKYIEEVEKDLLKYQLCFNCNFWREKVLIKDKLVIVNGKAYYPSPNNKDPARYRGFGGAVFNVQYFDGRSLVCDNMWFNGVIPPHFKERLPDNAKFIGTQS